MYIITYKKIKKQIVDKIGRGKGKGKVRKKGKKKEKVLTYNSFFSTVQDKNTPASTFCFYILVYN